MSEYQPGDYVKAVFKNEQTGESEWMWVRVRQADDSLRVVFGALDNEPVANSDLHLGMELAVSYDNIREHLKPTAFNQ